MKFKKPLFLLPLFSSFVVRNRCENLFRPVQNLRVAESRNAKSIVAIEVAFVGLTIHQQERARVKVAGNFDIWKTDHPIAQPVRGKK